MKKMKHQAGFTVPELTVFIGVVFIGIVLALVFIHPKNYDSSNRNAQRQLDLAHISQALTKYYKDHGSLPEGIIEEPTLIGNADPTALDLCIDLVPAYLKDMPTDPTGGTKLAVDTCVNTKEKPSVYSTGYTITQEKDGTVVLDAPAAEGGSITLSRKY